MAQPNQVADSWEDESAAPAASFNINATEFVPSWLKPAAPPAQASAPSVQTSSSAQAQTPSTQAQEAVEKEVVQDNSNSESEVVRSEDSSMEHEKKAVDEVVKEVAKVEINPEEAEGDEATEKAAAQKAEKVAAEVSKETPKTTSKPQVTPQQQPQVPIEDDVKLDAETEALMFEREGKEHLNICFMGHVDAGKSTIGGHLLYLTGMVDKRTLEKYEREAKEKNRESWYLSWALDTNPEERDKGKTVEVGRAYFETEKKKYTILDAPGHKSFVPNMIGGAAQADVGVLVISARKGEFEAGFDRQGQTREHAMLSKTAGIRRVIILVNKMDDPTVSWAKERYDEILEKLKPFLKQVGYNPKTDIDFLPASGFTGANLKDRVDTSQCSWYNGPALLELLDAMPLLERKIDGALRMPVLEKYRDMGTVIAGKIESGHVKLNQKVLLMPNNQTAEVITIIVEEEEKKVAVCGDNVRLRLRGIEEEEISLGFVLCDLKIPVRTSRSFEAQLVILDFKNIICAGFSAVMHIHTLAEEITIVELKHLVDRKTGKKTKTPPKFVKKGQVCIAKIETSGVICIERYKDYPQLGRFTIRDEGKTVAMGKVTKVLASSSEGSAN